MSTIRNDLLDTVFARYWSYKGGASPPNFKVKNNWDNEDLSVNIDKKITYIYNICMFEWDENKNTSNIEKHGVSFEYAKQAFDDPDRLILQDESHSANEERYFCLGKVKDEIITVRFVLRDTKIRIFGAGYWRKGKKVYEEHN